MDNQTKLDEVIGDGLEYLKGVEKGSDSYYKSVDALTKLLDKDNERKKLEYERYEKSEAQRAEQCLKVMQIKEDRIDKIVKNSLTLISVVGGFWITVWGATKSWKFEETGTITSSPGRKFTSLPFFKK